MSRPVLLLAAVALLAGVRDAEAKRRKKGTRDNRKPSRSTKANMPRGFAWPPTKHMVAMGEECTKSLAELGVTVDASKPVGRVVTPLTLPDRTIGEVTLTPVYRKHQVFDCQLVLALARFAPTLHELGVREVRYGSAFRWSKVRVSGRTKNILSRHGLGIALDIVSFVDADGREARVEDHYKRGDELLLSIEKAVNESGLFRLLLTPKNDPKSHHDHFHLEANPDYSGTRTPRPSS